MENPSITINGNSYSFRDGDTILDIAELNSVHIPTLCYLKDTTPTGACRICLVEVKGSRELVAACSTPAANGMIVYTGTEKVIDARRFNIELLLASGDHNCLTGSGDVSSWTDFQLQSMESSEHKGICPSYGDCRLQDLAIEYRVKNVRFDVAKNQFPTEAVNPFIIRDFSRCILCGRCVQACNELVVNKVISIEKIEGKSKVVTKGDLPYHESNCVFCGQCVEVCPVGALTEKKSNGFSMASNLKKVRTTCPYCGVGCQLWLHMDSDKIKKVTAVENGAPNKGRLCVKGRFGYDFIYSDERLTTPLIREENGFREASWDEALDLVADKFKDVIAKHGPDAVAGVSCARSLNEDSFQMQKLFRAVFRTNNIDHCART